MSVGHDEYWSGEQRRHVTEARDKGVNLMFLSGNDVYWKIRCVFRWLNLFVRRLPVVSD